MSYLRFLADGRKRALQGLEPRLVALRLDVTREIEAQYAPQLAAAGYFNRRILHLRMKREFQRRFAQAVEEILAGAPPDALY